MSFKIILIFLNFIVHQIMSTSDSIEEKDILRVKFLNDKRKNNVAATQIKLLEKYAANDSVLIDDIVHYKIKGHPELKEVNKIEIEFRKMLAMDGLTYIFNRDMAWRTWRKVQFEKEQRIVHYKYKTSINCTENCVNGGVWVIEKNPPPCALEIFSIDNNAVCAIHMKNYHLKTKECSSYLISLLTTTCDNPIVTKWVVQKTFSKKEKKQRFPVVICGGREYCRLLTVYKLTRDYLSFKIINSTNHIIYSRIMKSTRENYACVTNCGIYDQHTNTVKKSEKPMKLNMFNKKIEKREKKNENYNKIVEKKNEYSNNKIVEKKNENYYNIVVGVNDGKPKSHISNYFWNLKLSTPHPPSCMHLQQHVDEEDYTFDDEDDDEDDE